MNQLKKNYIYNIAYQIFMIVVPLFTAPYLTRVLGKEKLGIDEFVLSIVTMTQVIGAMGLNSYSNREIAYRRNNKKERDNVFYELLVMRLALCILSVTIYFAYASFSEYKIYFYIQSMTVIAYFLDITWFFIGIEEMQIIVKRNTIVRIFITASIFLFIRKPEDLGKYIFINAIGNAFAYICMYAKIFKYVGKMDKSRLNIRRHFFPMFLLFLPQAATQLFVQLDKTMLKYLQDDIAQVSLYGQSERLVKAPLAIINAITAVTMPRIANNFAEGDMDSIKGLLSKITDFILVYLIPVVFGFLAVASAFVPLYFGEGYRDAVVLVQILAPIILFIGISNITGQQYLVAANRTNILTLSYTAGAIINIGANFILIPRYHALGASLATVIAEFIVLVIQYIYIKREIGSLHLVKKGYKKLIAAIIMYFSVYYIGDMFKHANGLSLLTQILCGVFMYVVALVIMKDKMIYECITMGKGIITKNKKK